MNKKVAVAMSGGVDSSVATAILKRDDYDVIGLFMKLWTEPASSRDNRQPAPRSFDEGGNRCCDESSLLAARRVAAKLEIPLYVIDAEKEFKKKVVDYFIAEYAAGRTPNPCVVCNREIKFDLLWQKARAIGADYLATGHYAQVGLTDVARRVHVLASPRKTASSETDYVLLSRGAQFTGQGGTLLSREFIPSEVEGLERAPASLVQPGACLAALGSASLARGAVFSILKGKDVLKDQSYMLWAVNPKIIPQLIFPVGDKTKNEVRGLAKKWGLPVWDRCESQEICFVADSYREFLKRHIKNIKPGNIVDKQGNVLGEHRGLPFYTVGQREGLKDIRLPKWQGKSVVPPLYVLQLKSKENQVVVGEERDLYSNIVKISNVNLFLPVDIYSSSDPEFIEGESRRPQKVLDFARTIKWLNNKLSVQLRYHHPAVACRIGWFDAKKRRITIYFAQPQRAITPGQSAVLYCKGVMIGGGVITDANHRGSNIDNHK